MLKKFSLLVVFAIAGNGVGIAQKAFSTVDISISGDLIVTGNSILDHWTPSQRGALELRSPYYSGEFETGARYIRYDEQSFDESGFRSVYLFLGWHYPLSVTDNISIAPGFRIGTNFLTQDNKKMYFGGSANQPFIFHEDESIFAYELILRSKWAVSGRTSLTGSISYNRSILQIPFSVVYTSVGLSRTFSLPHWLQTVIK